MGKRWRKAAWRCWAVVLAVAVVVIPVASAADTEASAVPAKLTGRWTRTVTAADWKRAGATGFVTSFVGPYTMVVKANGKVSIIDFTATFSPLSGGRLSMRGVPSATPRRVSTGGRSPTGN